MVTGSGLQKICHLDKTAEEIIQSCKELLNTEIYPKSIQERRKVLFPTYSNQHQGKLLYQMIYEK